jgi:hypothetical protein
MIEIIKCALAAGLLGERDEDKKNKIMILLRRCWNRFKEHLQNYANILILLIMLMDVNDFLIECMINQLFILKM